MLNCFVIAVNHFISVSEYWHTTTISNVEFDFPTLDLRCIIESTTPEPIIDYIFVFVGPVFCFSQTRRTRPCNIHVVILQEGI